MIDLEALATAQRPRPERDIEPKRKKPRPSQAKLTPEERKAVNSAIARAWNARRGFTWWHRIALVLADGEWRTSKEIWKLLPPFPLRNMSARLECMLKAGVVERRATGAEPIWTVHFKTGKRMKWNKAKWEYRILNRDYVREAKRRMVLE